MVQHKYYRDSNEEPSLSLVAAGTIMQEARWDGGGGPPYRLVMGKLANFIRNELKLTPEDLLNAQRY